jgi:hypothetical protein
MQGGKTSGANIDGSFSDQTSAMMKYCNDMDGWITPDTVKPNHTFLRAKI